MNLDFLDAHERHWEDADLLEGKGRFTNTSLIDGMALSIETDGGTK